MNHPLPPETSDRPLAPGQRLAHSSHAALSPETEGEIRALMTKYPDKLAATLPALYLAQAEMGFAGLEAMKEVARILEIPEGHVFGVATFYTMYQKAPVGKFHFSVCTNISCALRGAAQLLEKVCEKTGVQPGQGPSADGMWSVEEVECLAGCGSGPCVQVNHDVYDEFVDEQKLIEVMEACKRGEYRPWAQ